MMVAASWFKTFFVANTCSVVSLISEMDADNVCFNEKKEATDQMELRELQEHVAVGTMETKSHQCNEPAYLQVTCYRIE